MAERKSSSVNSSHKRGPSIGRGWEEAKGEFYQEAFRTISSGGGGDSEKSGDSPWEAMLPSQRTKIIDTRTWGRATGRRASMRGFTRTLQRSNSVTAADIELETMPDLAQGFADEEETWNQLQRIRNMPVNMDKKRQLKAELLLAPTFRVRGLDLLHLRRRQIWRQFQHSTLQVFSFFSPWRSSIRSIEANFGTGVASYFLLIKWLLLLNLTITSIMAIFVIVPWELGRGSCPNLDSNYTLCPDSILDGCARLNISLQSNTSCEDAKFNTVFKSEECWQEYRSSIPTNFQERLSEPLSFVQDTVQGTGWLELTFAFYGYYHPAFLNWTDTQFYHVSLAYVLTVLFVLILSLVCMTKSVAAGFKNNIGLGKAWLHQYSDLVFASWDFCIDKASVADQKKKVILNALRAALADKAYTEEKASRTTKIKIELLLLRTFINLVVSVILGGSGYLIYLATDFTQTFDFNTLPTEDPFLYFKDVVKLLVEFLPSAVITTLNVIVPIIFKMFVGAERYSATFEIKLTLIRTVFLRLSSLLVLILTLYHSLKTSGSDSKCGTQVFNSMCWESHVGQQLYRLCIFDTAVTLVTTLLVKFPLTLVLRRAISPSSRIKCIGYPEFDLVGNTLDLVYIQSICWLGMFYCPVLPMVTTLKCIIVFYVKYFSLLVYALPPSRLYGASSSTSLFMNVLLLSFISCVLPLGYHFTSLPPSPSCGPFRIFATVWSVISEEISGAPEFVRRTLNFVGTAGFLVPAIILLLVALYYYRSKSLSNRAMADSFKEQLVMEGQDKQFLLAKLISVGKPNIQPSQAMD